MGCNMISGMIPRIVIAGTHSGSGKTSVSSGLMAALTARGLVVQPFKVGPDFIDPTHHTSICGRPSRNLDPYMMGDEGVFKTFSLACEGADIAVIEGVMGMFDGLEGTDLGSTAHISKLLEAPVVLIVDVKGMSRSANAIVKGYRDFDPQVRFAGVIFNCVGSSRHRSMIEEALSVKAFGWIPWRKDMAVESRHLGLRMAHETSEMKGFGELIERHCTIEAILDAAGSAMALPAPAVSFQESMKPHLKVGIAYDAAFCFYYQDNLDLLRAHGAELVFFSPMADHLPDVDGLYLGGGYPELHAEALEQSPAREEIKNAIEDGMPAYAECGGLVYLTESITAGREYKMAGVLPARAFQNDRFQALGYIDATCIGGTALLPPGINYRGHEFHYSAVECDEDSRFCLRLSRGKGIKDSMDGLFEQNTIAGYTHAYFTNRFALSFLDAVARMKKA